jgi:hypothetical protein
VTVSILAAVLTLGYMLPWMIAALRGKSNHWGIFVVNLLLGWTIIGWVIALGRRPARTRWRASAPQSIF